ncbi:MAG: ABC transporter substrate-binding protein [Clostridia bacterium]
MCAQIIDPRRYKKISKSQAKNKNINTHISDKKVDVTCCNKNMESKSRVQKGKSSNKKTFFSKFVTIICCTFLLIIIGFASKKLVKLEDMQIFNVFSNNDEKDNLVKSYDFKIGLTKLDTTDILKSKNLILNELALKASTQLISINKDYSIHYIALISIEKRNNKEYILKLNPEYELKIEDLKNTISSIKNEGLNNPYYLDISNILSIEEFGQDDIKVMLNSENPYFVYTLKFPIFKKDCKTSLLSIKNVDEKSIKFQKNALNFSLSSMTLTNYTDTNTLVSDFRNEKIDMFFSTSDSLMQLIGKHDYNVKKYRDGETFFIFGNKDSKLFSLKEVRQALVYSMNRDEIVKEVNNSFAETIDLPYIYPTLKYKYDLYGAKNILLSNGWTKVSDIYTKKINDENLKLELDLLVNEADITKIKIADSLSKNMQNTGIKINVLKLNETLLNEKIAKGEYDIVLSTVHISDDPNVMFLEKYLNINDKTDKAFDLVKSSDMMSLEENIKNLQAILSTEVACIGILARNTNIVYQKYILGFDDTNYMKIYDNLKYIGKTIEK